MGKKPKNPKATAALRREIARTARGQRQAASDEEWREEVEEIFKDTHPWLRCDKLSNVVLWVSIFTLLYWIIAGRFGWL